MAPAPFKRRGQVPWSPSALWEGTRTPDLLLRPEPKLTCETRDKLVGVLLSRQHRGCKVGQGRTEDDPCHPVQWFTLGSDTDTAPVGTAPEPLPHSAESKHSNQHSTLAQSCKNARQLGGRLFPGAAILLFVWQEWGVMGPAVGEEKLTREAALLWRPHGCSVRVWEGNSPGNGSFSFWKDHCEICFKCLQLGTEQLAVWTSSVCIWNIINELNSCILEGAMFIPGLDTST